MSGLNLNECMQALNDGGNRLGYAAGLSTAGTGQKRHKLRHVGFRGGGRVAGMQGGVGDWMQLRGLGAYSEASASTAKCWSPDDVKAGNALKTIDTRLKSAANDLVALERQLPEIIDQIQRIPSEAPGKLGVEAMVPAIRDGFLGARDALAAIDQDAISYAVTTVNGGACPFVGHPNDPKKFTAVSFTSRIDSVVRTVRSSNILGDLRSKLDQVKRNYQKEIDARLAADRAATQAAAAQQAQSAQAQASQYASASAEENRIRELQIAADSERSAREERMLQLQIAEQERSSDTQRLQAEAQIARETRAAELELRRLEADLAREDALLNIELQRLQAEIDRDARRADRDDERDALMLQLELAERGISVPGFSTEPEGPPAGAFQIPGVPGYFPAAPGARGASSFAPMPYGAAPGSVPAPPPVITPGAPAPEFQPPSPSGIPGFENWAFTPGGEMFGMGALQSYTGPNLPSSAMLEQGYRFTGPKGGQYTVVRPDGSTFTMSETQAKKDGVRVADPQTGRVFYMTQEGTTGVGVASTLKSFLDAITPAGVTAFSAYQQSQGGGMLTQQQLLAQQQQKKTSAGAVVAVGLLAIGGVVLFSSMGKKKK